MIARKKDPRRTRQHLQLVPRAEPPSCLYLPAFLMNQPISTTLDIMPGSDESTGLRPPGIVPTTRRTPRPIDLCGMPLPIWPPRCTPSLRTPGPSERQTPNQMSHNCLSLGRLFIPHPLTCASPRITTQRPGSPPVVLLWVTGANLYLAGRVLIRLSAFHTNPGALSSGLFNNDHYHYVVLLERVNQLIEHKIGAPLSAPPV